MQNLSLNSLATKRHLFWAYPIFLIAILLVLLLRLYPSPASISLTFLVLIFVPGFALSRLFKIGYPDDRLGNIILWLAIGLIYNFVLAFLALFINLNINQLVGLTIIMDLLFFIGTFIVDIIQNSNRMPRVAGKSQNENVKLQNFSFKSVFKTENIIYILLLFLILLVLITVNQLGANFVGDPLYHLATMRRVIEGQPLSIENIAHLKDQFHPAYIFSLWQIFLSLIAKISGANIFILWQEIPTALTAVVFLVWYWLLLKIFANRFLAVLGLLLFIIYYFGQNGYLYTRLPVPDTLNQLLILPLSFALAIKHVFTKAAKYKDLIVLSFFVSLMIVIHPTQYFYYLFVMATFGIIYAIFRYKDNDFRSVFQKIIYTGIANFAVAIPIFILIQLKGSTLTRTFSQFDEVWNKDIMKNIRFFQFDQPLKYAYIALPLVGLFIRKYRMLLFILGLFLIGPIVFNIPGLKVFLIENVSHVFVKRFYSSTGWPYLAWALLIGFILILIDRAISKFSKYTRLSFDIILAITVILIVFLQFKFELVANFYDKAFSKEANDWLSNNYYWLIIVLLIISITVYLWQKYQSKLLDFFTLREPRNLSMMLLTIIIVFFLSSPGQGHWRFYFNKALSNGRFFKSIEDPTLKIINPAKFGGMETIEFIRQNIPPKAVWDSTDANYVLSMLIDVHMASYTFGAEPTKRYEAIYDPNLLEEKRLELVRNGQINYILYLIKGNSYSTPFDNSQDFTKIYENNKAIIYQVEG